MFFSIEENKCNFVVDHTKDLKKDRTVIRNATRNDAPEICDIYNYYIKNTIITFEEKPIEVDEIRNRMTRVMEKFPWLVYENDNKIVGYAYADQWKIREAYRYSVESAIYIKPQILGKGIGTLLYQELIKELKNRSIHVIIGGIALPNDTSVAFHEKFGFNKIAQFKEVGYKFNKWIDVGYWELILK